jgi:hypothetical protein
MMNSQMINQNKLIKEGGVGMNINLYSIEKLMQQTTLDIEKDAKTTWYWRATRKDQKNVFILFLSKLSFMKQQQVQVKPTACCSC